MRTARLFVLCSIVTGLLALPGLAAAEEPTVSVTGPVDGAVVRGDVEVVATAGPTVISVAYDWSDDDGTSWSPIATDDVPVDGWTATWDTGSYSGPALLRATATTADDESGSDQVEVTVDNTAPVVTASVTKDPMSPNGDAIRDITTFIVTLDEPAELSVLLRGPQGGVVKRFRDGGRVVAGTYRYEWKGLLLDADGTGYHVAPDGRYTLDVDAVDDAGNPDSATTTVVVDTKAPTFWWKNITPDPVTSTTTSIHMSFHVADVWTDRMTISFTLLDAVGIVRMVGGLSRLEGDRTIVWLPRYLGSTPLIPGNYRVRMTVKDEAGNARVTGTHLFRMVRPVTSTVYSRVEGTGSKMALTFDDCTDSSAWNSILNTLAARGTKATFFCNGVNVDAHPSLSARTFAAGHAIGSHTYDHSVLPGRTAANVGALVLKDQQAWGRAAGVTPAPYFRPPYGAYDSATLAGVGPKGFLRTVMWDVDPLDWQSPGASVIVSRVVSASRAGSIVVLHVKDQTAQALNGMITGLRNKGLTPVSLPVLFRAGGWR